MSHKIKYIEPDSIAAQLGLLPGDALVSINGERIIDFVDYQALCCNEQLAMVVERGAEQTEYSFEKDEYEPLGIEFENDMLGNVRTCVNKCMFCFVDQLPENVRDTMLLKDDDWRFSLLMGNYVTLTNVSDAELDRIIKRGASPLYISVHATDTETRKKLLGCQVNCDIMPRLRKLADAGICFHTQAVVCPGINDGKILEQTIDDLASLYPACQTLGIVPVGLTKHREKLCGIEPFTKETATALLTAVEKKRKRCRIELGTNFAFPSDELYIKAGFEFPSDSDYEDYAQIDNGIGLCRQLITDFEYAYEDLPAKCKKGGKEKKRIAIATGVSAKPVLEKLLKDKPITGVSVDVYAVENKFFGETVTVAGLVTGRDLIGRMKNVKCDAVLITEVMLRSEGDKFLDDVTLEEAEKQIGKPISVVGRRGEDLLDAIMSFSDAR